MDHDQILIIGGGIGGLALGLALGNHKITSRIYEQAPTYSDISSGLVLAPNGMKALDQLGHGIGTQVRRIGRTWMPGQATPFLTADGRVVTQADAIAQYPERHGAPAISLLRHELHTILREACGTDAIQMGAAFTSYTEEAERVIARFANGAHAAGYALVGADGLRSTVRAQVIDATPPRYTGITSVRGVVRGLDHPYVNTGFISTGPGITVFSSPIGNEGLYWVVTIAAPEQSWPRDPTEARERVLVRLAGWHTPITAMIRASNLETIIVTDIYDRDPSQCWSCGRATLLGDAAHPMAPTMGQGANQALEDSICLAQALAQAPTLETAFAQYESQRIARAAKVVQLSRQYTAMNRIENRLVYGMMSRAMGLMLRFVDQRKQDDWLFGLPLEGQQHL